MKTDLASRRMFLQGAGATLAIPFLSSLLPRSARAAVPVQSKYVHLNSNLCLPRAVTYPLYANPYPSYPQPGGTTPMSVPWTQHDADTKSQSLQDVVTHQGKVSWLFDEKWNPFVSRLSVVTNAHAYMASDNHSCGISSACSNVLSGPLASGDIAGPNPQHGMSADWLVERAWNARAPTQLPAIRFNLYDNDGGYNGFAFGKTNGQAQRLYMLRTIDELKSKLAGTQNTNPDDPKRAQRLARIDSVLADYRALMNHRRISAVDKQRLSNAADLWQAIERQSMAPGMPGACAMPSGGDPGENWGARHRLGMDLITAALACGVTRTVSYGLIQGGDTLHDQGLLHGWEHDPRGPVYADPQINDRYFVEVLRWRSDTVTTFLSRLDAMKDENGAPLLDSSLVVWAHQYSNFGHAMLGHTLVAAGGANGRLQMGRHVDAGGAPVNRFHLTNLLAMGLPMSDIELDGNVGFGEVSTPIRTGDTSNAVITREQDDKQNDPTKRSYDTSKLAHFQSTAERRKPFFYLKP